MTRRKEVFKIMASKRGEDILAYIYQHGPVSTPDICNKFKDIGYFQVRHLTNKLSSCHLIKCVSNKTKDNPRGKSFDIDDESLVISLLELEI